MGIPAIRGQLVAETMIDVLGRDPKPREVRLVAAVLTRLGVTPEETTPSVREVGGRLIIDWPEPRPRQFRISAEAFEALIARANWTPSSGPTDIDTATYRDFTCSQCTWTGPNPVHVHFEDHINLHCPNCFAKLGAISA